MIELSPKALRFARLVAEAQQDDAGDAHVDELRHREREHEANSKIGNVAKYISISDELARFSLIKILSFLRRTTLPDDDWDGNDILYLQSISTYLSEKLPMRRGL